MGDTKSLPRVPRVPRQSRSGAPGVRPLTVVGIGASAGGLKALQQFVEALPPDSGMAFVVILHLDPERESRMSHLLQDRASIPVTQVKGSTVVHADHIYIIPPGHDLAMRGHTLGLRKRGPRADHAPVDLFFRTLAEAYGADAVGVILSGTGADGTAGIRYLREAGGITVAQSPDEAEYDGMPASAISTGLIDLVLPSGQIPAELIRLRRFGLPAGEPVSESGGSAAALVQIFAALRSRTGHDFSLYRRSTVMRRLDRRLRFNGVTSLEEYQKLLHSSSAECHALLRDLLISVSSFFRDPDAFEALAALVPGLFQGKRPEDTVRVWIVGCATGEEVYSIAMVLEEHAASLAEPPRIQLFATDIDERGYGWARGGLYTTAAVASMSAERLERFFTKETGGYRISKSLRERVLFACHNVLHDPPFSRMDLISCRNLFIYLNPEAQERVLETFHFALAPRGLLFLGASESAGDAGLFAAAAGTHRLYRRGAGPHRATSRVSAADPTRAAGPVESPGRIADAATQDLPELPAPDATVEERDTVPRPDESELEKELRRTRQVLEATNASHDRTVAELQTVNEELQSINEEQTAAAEELETSREEIQSINEELTTINQEHQSTIEELKRTNADLQNLIESTEIGTIFLDRAMKIRRFTPAVTTLFNFVESDQGRPLGHITHRLDYPALTQDVGMVLETLERIEREVESDTGECFIVRISPYRSLDGGNEGAVITFFDNTMQHRAAEELREARITADSANRAKGTFLSTLSHEFRTPLNAILGYASLLPLDGELNATQVERVERIKTGSWHLAAMIEEILSFAKLDAGHEVVQLQRRDAREIASEAAALVEPAARDKGLDFMLELPDAALEVLTDEGKARQILINLCGNAVKYTDAGTVRLRVTGDTGRVNFRVVDTGIGIAMEHRDRVFERFWQVDGAATRPGGGMGIGLAVAREYARLLGGDVELESEPGVGTTFDFWLPAA